MLMSVLVMSLKAKFPGAKNITTDNLQTVLEQNPENVLLLDVRQKEEYDVSHIKGAICVGNDAEDVDVDAIIHNFLQAGNCRTQDPLIACYCSVGYRSSKLAARLRVEKGYESAANVEGSIFKWANEGKELWKSNQRLDHRKVHPYNSFFGHLLNQNLRSEIPADAAK